MADKDKSFDSNSHAINPQFDKSDGDSEELSDYGSDQEAKYRGKIRKEKNKQDTESKKGKGKKKKKPIAHEPIPEPGPEESKNNEDDTSVVDKVAIWFKDIFNVCGKSSCCASSNPYYDKKSWNDLSGRISYANEEIEQ